MSALTRNYSDWSTLLLSDGQRLCLKWPSWSHSIFCDGFMVTSLTLDVDHDCFDVSTYGSPYTMQISGRTSVAIGLEIRCSNYESIPKEKADRLFRTAESMSVNDLLATAYQKMNERDQ
jgi:hypothetical protein